MLAKIEIEDQEKLVKLKKVMDICTSRYEAQTVPNMKYEHFPLQTLQDIK